jgi:hypothetical protein
MVETCTIGEHAVFTVFKNQTFVTLSKGLVWVALIFTIFVETCSTGKQHAKLFGFETGQVVLSDSAHTFFAETGSVVPLLVARCGVCRTVSALVAHIFLTFLKTPHCN